MKIGVEKTLIKIFLFVFILLLPIFPFVYSLNLQKTFNATMTVEANIIGFANPVSEVSIEVPDYIFLGNVTKDDPVSEEVTIKINNTGKTDIIVVPQLKDSGDEIFSHLFFRKQKTTSTNDTSLTEFYRIGNFSIDIDKPASGKNYRTKSFYMKLDLRDFEGEIDEDLIGYKTDILFLAMAK